MATIKKLATEVQTRSVLADKLQVSKVSIFFPTIGETVYTVCERRGKILEVRETVCVACDRSTGQILTQTADGLTFSALPTEVFTDSASAERDIDRKISLGWKRPEPKAEPVKTEKPKGVKTEKPKGVKVQKIETPEPKAKGVKVQKAEPVKVEPAKAEKPRGVRVAKTQKKAA